MTVLIYLQLNLSLSLHHNYARYKSDGESWKVNVDNPGVLSVQLRVQCICRSVTMYETM